MSSIYCLKNLDDDRLIAELKTLAGRSQRISAALLAHISEVDARKLFRRDACSSMFVYCTDMLHLSESETYKRIGAARAARRFPVLFEMVERAQIHLSGIKLVAPYLTEENHRDLLAAASHQSTRNIERMIAKRFPKPDVPASIRKLPTPVRTSTPVPTPTPPPSSKPAVVAPLSSSRFKIQFTASAALHDKLRQAQDLLRHQIPDGDVADVIERALDILIKQRLTTKCAQTNSPRHSQQVSTKAEPSSRHIPNAIKRQVVERCGMRCTFKSATGRRCSETSLLEFHHIKPFALGGDHSAENITLLCRSHNAYFCDQDFPTDFVDGYAQTSLFS